MKLTVNNASFSYTKNKTVFSNLSFSINKGEILSVLGPNGCGKTTLLKCIAGIRHFNSGIIRKDNWKNDYSGYVPQLTSSPVAYQVFKMVLMGRSRFIGHFSKFRNSDFEKVQEILEKMNISNLAERSFNSLSGGERQMVLIARALATEAEILIFDEPTSALDLVRQHRIVDLMRKLSHEEGLSIIFSTHNPSHALHISDKTILMNRDGSSLFGKSEEMISEKTMKQLFEVEIRIMKLEHRCGAVTRPVVPVLEPY